MSELAKIEKGTIYNPDGSVYEPIQKIGKHWTCPIEDNEDSDDEEEDPTFALLLISTRDLTIFKKALQQYYAHKLRSREATRKRRHTKPNRTMIIRDRLARAHLMYSKLPKDEIQTLALGSRKATSKQLLRFFANCLHD